MIVIDGKNAILGRLASHTAKQLLKGEEVHIVNAEKIIISGNVALIKERYLSRRRRGSAHHGPYFPKNPDAIVRRTVRSMLPYKTLRGRVAFKKLRVHVDIPEKFSNIEKNNIDVKQIRTSYIKIGEISKVLGWHS